MSLSTGGIVSLGGGTSSGSGGSSGIMSLNSQTGPAITITGVNGVTVSAGGNTITIDGAGASGATGGSTKYAASFSSISSGQFFHGLNTLDVIVQVRDNPNGGGRVLMPDDIIIDDPAFISLVFNIPTSGRVVIV